jgi:hypothetical protein
MSEVSTPIACPVDYALFEFPDEHATGEAAQAVLDLVDAGMVRIYDITAIRRATDGTVDVFEMSAFPGEGNASFAALSGAQSGILDADDVADAAAVLEPGTLAVLVVYENAWLTPFVQAADRAGGRLVAGDRIQTQDIIDTLDALDLGASGQAD